MSYAWIHRSLDGGNSTQKPRCALAVHYEDVARTDLLDGQTGKTSHTDRRTDGQTDSARYS